MGTATKLRSVTLRDYELRRLRDTGSVCVVRAMPKQPECLRIPAISKLAGSCYTFTHDGYWWATKSKPPGEVGDVVAVKEAWGVSFSNTDGEPTKCRVWYRAHNDRPTWAEAKWRSPATMPPWAVRTFAVLASVRAGQVQGVTFDEAIAAGARQASATQYGCYQNDTVEGFAELHNAHTRNPAHKWERNPWCWVGVFQLRGDE